MAFGSGKRLVAPELLVVLGAAALAGVTMLWNIATSPDTQYDEVVYTRAAQQVAQSWSLTWTNEPMFVHPPLSFLAQAAWLRLLGLGNAPLEDAIVAARVLTALAMVFAFLLVGLLAAYLAPRAGRRRALVIVAAVVVVAATDPELLRYGRLAMIEPLALIAALLTLCLAIWLRERPFLVYVPVVGLATGLTLLTKEVTAFLVLTPVVFHLLGGDWRRMGTALAGFAWGMGLWVLFPLWAVALGQTSTFVDAKFSMLERLTGLLQITGWNRPGVSFFAALGKHAFQYGTSYLILATGGLALLWLLLRSTSGPARWLLAWLLTSYGFGAYTVLLGTLNEQFFVYIMPAAIVGTVLMVDTLLARFGTARRAARAHGRSAAGPTLLLGAVGTVAVLLLGLSLGSWAAYYLPANDGVFKTVAYLRERTPACAVLSTTGDPDSFQQLLPGRTVTAFATGEGAVSHGVHLFVVSDKEIAEGSSNSAPEFPSWLRSRGTQLAAYPSATYGGLQLWQVPVDPYEPLADTEEVPGGFFVTTEGSRCAGFGVLDGPTGGFADGWQKLGGKGVVGPPLTGSYAVGAAAEQVFSGAVLRNDGAAGVRAARIVATLASARPEVYQRAQLPPITRAPGGSPAGDQDVLAQLTDPVIAAAYLRTPTGAAGPSPTALPEARALFGDPLGPVTRMPDGAVRQAFDAGVFERAESAADAHLAPVGQLVVEAGLVTPTPAATTPTAPPPLPPTDDLGPDRPTSVQTFVISLLAAIALYIGLPVIVYEVVAVGRRRRPPGPPPGWERRR